MECVVKTFLLTVTLYDPISRAWVFRSSSQEGDDPVDAWRRFVDLHVNAHEAYRNYQSALLINAWELTPGQIKQAADEGW